MSTPIQTIRPMSPEMIQRLRQRLGISQAEMANRLLVSKRTIIRWEAGQSIPSPVFLVRMRELG